MTNYTYLQRVKFNDIAAIFIEYSEDKTKATILTDKLIEVDLIQLSVVSKVGDIYFNFQFSLN